jgi:UDPglucose 6-dehydrogenase
VRIAMIGAGYVGLVSGACLADFGHTVWCVDKLPGRIDALKRGEIPIFEPGLADLVATNARAGRLRFTGDLAQAMMKAEAILSPLERPRVAVTALPILVLSSAVLEKSPRPCMALRS